MKKTLTVSELAKKYESAVDKMKPTVLKEVKSEKYIDYEDKITKMNNVIISTHVDKDTNVRVNTPMKFVLFSISVIDMYTNIQVDLKDVLKEFNMLHKVGLIDRLIHPNQEQDAIIPVNEVTECAEIMSMISEDFMVNNYGVSAMFNKFFIFMKEMLPNILNEYMKSIDVETLNGK